MAKDSAVEVLEGIFHNFRESQSCCLPLFFISFLQVGAKNISVASLIHREMQQALQSLVDQQKGNLSCALF